MDNLINIIFGAVLMLMSENKEKGEADDKG